MFLQIEKGKITVLVLGHNFAADETFLNGFSKLRLLVADGSNNARTVKALRELCLKFGVGFYDTRDRGAYQLEL